MVCGLDSLGEGMSKGLNPGRKVVGFLEIGRWHGVRRGVEIA